MPWPQTSTSFALAPKFENNKKGKNRENVIPRVAGLHIIIRVLTLLPPAIQPGRQGGQSLRSSNNNNTEGRETEAIHKYTRIWQKRNMKISSCSANCGNMQNLAIKIPFFPFCAKTSKFAKQFL